jgi:predicted TIM-barrel fold metal-dependent hydrolase
VLYGSDAPYRHPARHRQWFEELALSPAEREMVCAGTACRLLGL